MSAVRIQKQPNHMWHSALYVAPVKCMVFVLTVRNNSSMLNYSYYELLILLSLVWYGKGLICTKH